MNYWDFLVNETHILHIAHCNRLMVNQSKLSYWFATPNLHVEPLLDNICYDVAFKNGQNCSFIDNTKMCTNNTTEKQQ